MPSHAVPALVVAVALTGLLVVVAWKAARHMRPWLCATMRAFTLLAAPLGVLVFLTLASSFQSSGTWMCPVCGLTVERMHYLGVQLWSDDAKGPDADSTFSTWFLENVHQDHQHDWQPSGCHSVGAGTIACYFGPTTTYYSALPKMEDVDLAAHLARTFAAAPPVQRDEMLESFSGVPTRSPDKDSLAIDPAWLAEHPAWK